MFDKRINPMPSLSIMFLSLPTDLPVATSIIFAPLLKTGYLSYLDKNIILVLIEIMI
jgi:hypothetical protein